MTLTPHPGHTITITTTPIRTYLDCTCGLTRTFANNTPAIRAALHHHHNNGGCNCPPHIQALDIHPKDVQP